MDRLHFTGLIRSLPTSGLAGAVRLSRRAVRLLPWVCLAPAVAGGLHCMMADTGSIDFTTGKTGKDPKNQPKPCAGDGECAPPTPYCDAVFATCIECLADPNCGGPKHFCGPRGACVECVGDPGCSKGKPYCNLERYACAECLTDAHCDATNVCDTANQRCVPSCADSSTCDPMKPYCDAARRICVECSTDVNCADAKKPACTSLGVCAECTSNPHCSADRPICDRTDDKCVGCTSDLDCPDQRRCDPMRRCAP